MVKIVFNLFLLVFSGIALASGGTLHGKIEKLYVNNTWTMVHVPSLIDTNEQSQVTQNNPDGCVSISYYAIVPEDQNYSALHSTLLAAYFSGKDVSFYVAGCGGQNGAHPKIISVWVHN